MTDDFDIIALNGITGDCLTTADDSTQRVKENPPDPLEAVRQEHEGFLTELEALAVLAIAFGDWSRVRDLISDFKNFQDDSAAVLERPGADASHRP